MKFHRLAALAFVFPAALAAQTLTPLTQFDFPADGNTGGQPQATVIQASDGYIYAADANQGPSGDSAGAVLRIDPTTGVASVFYGCSAEAIDCNAPDAILQLPNGKLLVASALGGANGAGNLFTLDLATAAYTNLYNFTGGTDGYQINNDIIYDPATDSVYGTTLGNPGSGSASQYGSIFKISGIVSGTVSLAAVHDFGTSDPAGYQTTAGVTEVGGKIYGANQLNGAGGYGAVFVFDSGLTSSTTLETFSSSGPTFPYAAPRYYGPTGMLYGVTFNYGITGTGGAVYSVSKTGAGPIVYAFTNNSLQNTNGKVAFDTEGNIIFGAGKGGTNSAGAQYLVRNSGGTPTTLFSYNTTDEYGAGPQASAFIDNKGHLWTVQFRGTPNGLGSIDSWSLSTETAAPLSVTSSAASVTAGSGVTITYKGTNLFSDNEQKCFGANSGIASWDGKYISGTYSNGTYSGSLAVMLPTAKTYTFTIVCGGMQSAQTTVTATAPASSTTTALTINPNVVAAGANVTVTATVKKTSGSGTPTGNVVFSTNGVTLTTVPLNGSGVASFTSPANVAKGNYTITAAYGGDTHDNASSGTASVSVRNASAASLTVNPSTFTAGGTTTVTMKATGSAGTPTGTISLVDGGTTITTQTLGSGGSVSFSASSAGYPKGTYNLQAVYNGNATYAPSVSAAVPVTLK